MKEGKSNRGYSKGAYVESIVCSLIATNLCLERKQVQPASSFKDLGADMLDFYSIMLDLEAIFRIPILDSESRRFVTVGDVVIWILEYEQTMRFTIPVFVQKQFDHSI